MVVGAEEGDAAEPGALERQVSLLTRMLAALEQRATAAHEAAEVRQQLARVIATAETFGGDDASAGAASTVRGVGSAPDEPGAAASPSEGERRYSRGKARERKDVASVRLKKRMIEIERKVNDEVSAVCKYSSKIEDSKWLARWMAVDPLASGG